MKLLLFAILLLALDRGLGWGLHKAFRAQTSGKFYRMTETIERSEDQLVVFGSSHATRHYDPLVFENLLGTSCYNAGVQGRGILFVRAVQQMRLARHRPERMILNIDPGMLYARTDNYERLSDLLPFYQDHPEAHATLHLRHPMERYKLWSRLYAYNSTLVHIVKYRLVHQPDQKGYRPHRKALDPDTYQRLHRNTTGVVGATLDSNNVQALADFLAEAQQAGTEVIAVVSPTYFGETDPTDSSFQKIKALLQEAAVELWDYRDDPDYVGKAEWFFDEHHLNDSGAEAFSRAIALRIKERS
ncbi:MAG: hypothetical protein AAGB22_09355 [Bacteroidota bacterium]